MVCPPVRGDNPRALASGLSPVQMDELWYTTYISVDLVHYDIFDAKVGKGGKMYIIHLLIYYVP